MNNDNDKPHEHTGRTDASTTAAMAQAPVISVDLACARCTAVAHADVADIDPSECPLEQLEALRLDGDYVQRVKTVRYPYARLLTSKDLKPGWTHIHPDDANSCWLQVVQHEGELYLVAPGPHVAALKDHLGTGMAQLVLTTQGVLGVWWLPHLAPGIIAKSTWNVSALEIAAEHAGACVRLHTVKGANVYEAEVADPATLPPPVWPDAPFMALVEQAFGRRVIMDDQDPVARALLETKGAK